MERTDRARVTIKLTGKRRLARLLGVEDRRAARTPSPTYAEDEVRDRIYGWRSGTVERPEPADSAPPLDG
jgi:hypothetical protein